MIKNKTKNTIISAEFSRKRGLAKILGLIAEKAPKTVVFTTRLGIHTFFMSFAIDVLILNKSKEIVSIKENLKPNKIFFWNPIYKTVIELPPGSILKSKTQTGDIVSFDL